MVKLCYTTSNSGWCFVTGPSLHTDKVCSWPSGREFVEVYVSSVANPQTFFVQILTSMSLRLDEIVKSMSQYYATERQVRIHITVLRQKLVSMLQGYATEKYQGEYIAVPCNRNTGERTLKIICESTNPG